MKIVISESQLKVIISEQTSNLTVTEQTLLGFLSKFLKGDDGEFRDTPMDELEKSLSFNSKTIYPMVEKLLEKKNTGKKTYDDKTFKALFNTMGKFINKDQQYEFFLHGGKITSVTYNTEY